MTANAPGRRWTFVTTHAQVLLAIAENRGRTVAEIAKVARITERSAFRILADLEQTGYVRRAKHGRRNAYELHPEVPLAEPLLEDQHLAELVALVSGDAADRDPVVGEALDVHAEQRPPAP